MSIYQEKSREFAAFVRDEWGPEFAANYAEKEAVAGDVQKLVAGGHTDKIIKSLVETGIRAGVARMESMLDDFCENFREAAAGGGEDAE